MMSLTTRISRLNPSSETCMVEVKDNFYHTHTWLVILKKHLFFSKVLNCSHNHDCDYVVNLDLWPQLQSPYAIADCRNSQNHDIVGTIVVVDRNLKHCFSLSNYILLFKCIYNREFVFICMYIFAWSCENSHTYKIQSYIHIHPHECIYWNLAID